MIGRDDRIAFGPAAVTVALALVAAVLGWLLLSPALGKPATGGYDIDRMVLLFSTLPRLATALVAGAALALSGTLFQLVLRNPLASPTTLGISAGANLTLVLATLFMPGLLGLGRDLVALAGSALAALLVMSLGARRGFSPFSLVLSGLVVSLWCGSLAAILTLLNDRYLVSLFIWGAGSLAQQSWSIPLSLAAKTGLIVLCCALVLKPLSVLDLGEDGAAALGVKIVRLRVIVVSLAVALSAIVTSAVGVIGFIGLVSPTICRLAGARRPTELMVWSTLSGAMLLLIADEAVQYFSGAIADFLPTGAVTAIFGSPLLLLLLPRLKMRHGLPQGPAAAERRAASVFLLPGLIAAMVFVVLIGLFLGRALDGGWMWLGPKFLDDLLALRAPKVLAAMASGAMLAVAGVILQRLTGNEMASPEVLGVSAGATLGMSLALFVLAAPDLLSQTGFAAAGALIVLAAIFLFAARSGFAADRVLLAGIALGAMVDAVVGVLTATGDPRALLLMSWMSGSTYGVDWSSALAVTGAAVVLVAAGLLARRWLDLLPLGTTPAAALGVPLTLARLALFGLAGLMSAAAALTVGPLSFIGLMGPHLAREAGLARALPQVAGAAAIGGSLMVAADWIGRTAVYPYQIPAGLISALVGAPILMLMLRKKG